LPSKDPNDHKKSKDDTSKNKYATGLAAETSKSKKSKVKAKHREQDEKKRVRIEKFVKKLEECGLSKPEDVGSQITWA
jgi:hypothetical protein